MMNLLSSSLKYFFLALIGFLLLSPSIKAQDSDELFQRARNAAFEKKDYPLAIRFSHEALVKSPGYNEIRVFLGRLYTWSAKPDSAKIHFETVLSKEQGHEDASLAYASLEYWSDNNTKALKLVNTGLESHPESEDLLLLNAKILNSQRDYVQAEKIISQFLKLHPKNTEARAMSQRIKENSSKNKIGVSYDFVHFDKQFEDPWHLTSFDYGRQTKIGLVSARINYANRFKSNGLQFELDAYPKISPTFYTYASIGYSADDIFPSYRGGFSLYANLPASFEADAGFRFLKFDNDTWVYTFGLGKYYKSYWFNLRSYLTPSANVLSQSYSVNVRYYFGGADDYIKFGAGTGLSPDESSNLVLIGGLTDAANSYRLKSNNLNLGFVHTIKTFNIVSLNVSWLNQEFRENTFGNQSTISLNYQRRF